MLTAFGDGTVFGRRVGEGAPQVVCLHGWARDSSDFELMLQKFDRLGIPAVALDLPGFGASPSPSTPGGARHYADLLAPVLEALGSSPVVVVGHSFGGRIAVPLAVRHPDLVRGLVLAGVPLLRLGPPPRAHRSVALAKLLHRAGLLSAARLERLRRTHGSADYRAATGDRRATLVATVAETYEDELRTWSGPTRLVWGALDTVAPVAIAEAAHTMMVSSDLEIVEGVGHLEPLECPDRLVAAARTLLA